MCRSPKPNSRRVFLALGIGSLAGCSAISSEDQGCKTLLQAVETYHLVAESRPLGRPYCEPTAPRLLGYYQYGVYYAPDKWPPDWVGSALLGWYAVRRSDGRVYEWDIAEDALGAPVSE
jgi:hypothetical protein